jgi:hypothetical protein
MLSAVNTEIRLMVALQVHVTSRGSPVFTDINFIRRWSSSVVSSTSRLFGSIAGYSGK